MRARYAGTVQDFHSATRPERLELLVRGLGGGRLPKNWHSTGEAGSWARSLPALADALIEAGLERLWVVLEYNPFQAGRSRADAIVIGELADGRPSYLVVELKQWQNPQWDAELECVTGVPYGSAHPYDQARRYGLFIRNYTDGMSDESAVRIEGAAYLHNATEQSIAELRGAGVQRSRWTFSGDGDGRRRFREALSTAFAPNRHGTTAKDRLLAGTYRQAPALLQVASRIFSDPQQFPLTDEQDAVFRQIQNAVTTALRVTSDRREAVIVVKGGPGTGKTWIAMHLLAANAGAGRQISYATNSASLCSALRKNAQAGDVPIQGLITSARVYHGDEAEQEQHRWNSPLDLLVVDEAHRLERWNARGKHANKREVQQRLEAGDITQLYELKKSAKVLVLFIDEGQAATSKDYATTRHAELIADRTGASYQYLELGEQHRSGGSQAYEAWVDALIDGTPIEWHDEPDFTVRVANSPEELEKLVFNGSPGSARLLAGFCWKWQPWPDQVSSIEDVPFDIDIDGWHKRWNLKKPISGYPRDTDWAARPSGVEQVGSTFTAQGFEFDRCGVIMGPDLVIDNASQRLTTNIDASEYGKLKVLHRSDVTASQKIRNQYRVLLTRAMRQVVVYSTDPDTQALLKEIVNP